MTKSILVALVISSLAASAAAQTATPTTTPTVTPTRTPTQTPTAVPTLSVDVCFAVPNSSDNLVRFDPATGSETVVGLTGAPNTLRGLAVAPLGASLYGATASQLGSVNVATGAFTNIGSFGTAVQGDLGPVELDDLRGLTYDPADGVLYGVHRTTLDADVCYGIAATGDSIVRIDRSTGLDTLVGATSNGVQAAALVGSSLYGAIGAQLGVLDRDSGTFAPRGSTFGQGDPGAVTFNDVRGLTFDPVQRVMFASHRVVGSDDVLFLVDLATGAHVPLQFNGAADDYTTISGGTCVSPVDIEALAMDPAGGVLYGSSGNDLLSIAPATGVCTLIGDFGNGGPPITITDLSFADDGTLHGSDTNQFYTIDTGSGAATPLGGPLGVGSDYRSLACPIAVPDVLFRVDPTTGSYVPLHFDFDSADYVLIEGGGCSTEVEALAHDAFNDVLLGIDATDDYLMEIDPESGSCTNNFGSPLGVTDLQAMTYAAATNQVLASNTSNLYQINRISGAATLLAPLTAGTDYQALECPTQGCNLVLRKSHQKTGFSGSTVDYRLFWLNPCEGAPASNVVITDILPNGLELVAVESNFATVQIQGNSVTLTDASLPQGPAAEARISVAIDAAAGTQLVNQASLRDVLGRIVTAQDRLNVRADKNTGKTLELSGHEKTRPGARASVIARYQRLGSGNSLVMTLPAGVTLESVHPEPSTTVGSVLTWNGLPTPAGQVKVKLFFDTNIVAPNLVTVEATLDDASIDPVSHSHAIRVLGEASGGGGAVEASMKLNAPRRVRAGLVAQLGAAYRKISGTATVTVTLPAGMTLESALPDGASVNGQTLQWQGLPGPAGKVKLKVLIGAGVGEGSLLPVSASMTSTGGDSAGGSATVEVR